MSLSSWPSMRSGIVADFTYEPRRHREKTRKPRNTEQAAFLLSGPRLFFKIGRSVPQWLVRLWSLCHRRGAFRAQFDDADGVDDAVGWRHRKAAFGQELPNQRRRFRMRHRRLHADAHEAVRVIECFPRVPRELGPRRVR